MGSEVRERIEAQEEAGLRELDAIMEQMEADDVPEVPAGTVQPKTKSAPETSMEPSNDFWESDRGKGPGVKSTSSPEKRLFAPVGNDCPFGAGDFVKKGH